jgi:hypothetical protein
MRRSALFALAIGLLSTSALSAQNAKPAPTGPKTWADSTIVAERYVTPPAEVARLVTAPRENAVSYASPSPVTRRWFVRSVSDGMPTLALMGKPYHNLGGFQVDIRGYRSRSMTTGSRAGIELYERTSGTTLRFRCRPARASAPPRGRPMAAPSPSTPCSTTRRISTSPTRPPDGHGR